jgi:hypothetical protein
MHVPEVHLDSQKLVIILNYSDTKGGTDILSEPPFNSCSQEDSFGLLESLASSLIEIHLKKIVISQ